MAGNFWNSSHYEQWIFDKNEITRMRCEDLKIFTEEEYNKIMIFWANMIQMIAAEGMQTGAKSRMQVVSTACVYFKRFYIRHSFKDVDPFLMCCSSLYLASKVEEHGQMSMTKMTNAIPNIMKKYPNVPYENKGTNTVMCEAEFILVETMDCCLIVYHPYRPLTSMLQDIAKELSKDGTNISELEAQCWKVANDTLRSDCSLLFPPHIIACSCIIVGAELLNREKDIKNWLPELTIDLEKVMDCVKLIVSTYQLWKGFDEKEQLKPLLEKLPKIQAAPLNNLNYKKMDNYDEHHAHHN